MLEKNLRHFVTACFGLTGFACSDPVPPAAEAGVHIEIRQSSTRPSGTNCSTTATTQDFGNPSPTAQVAGSTIIDGESGSRINCSVKAGDVFSVSGSVRAGNLTFDVVDGQVPSSGTGKGTISVYTPETYDLQDTACDIVGIDVKAGAIWASFNCQNLAKPPSTVCGAKGFFVFQNCTK
jgi:hypothetical protein